MSNRTPHCGGVAHEMHGSALYLVDPEPPASLANLPLLVLTRVLPSSAKDFVTAVHDIIDGRI